MWAVALECVVEAKQAEMGAASIVGSTAILAIACSYPGEQREQ